MIGLQQMPFQSKDLLSLQPLNADDISLIFKTADSMKEVLARPIPRVPALQGKTIALVFSEPSTRTRASFEIAARNLSASTTSLALGNSSVKKGESIIDTARNLEAAGVDGMIIRHNQSGVPYLVANHIKGPVVNAGDGEHEHPTQGLLDIFTMREKKGPLRGKHVVIVGDIAHSRVARSNIFGLVTLGAKVTVVGPPTLIPMGIEQLGVKVSYKLDEAIETADFINVLRIQLERQAAAAFPSIDEYIALYGINADRLKKAKKDVVVLHPGPINRGVELSSEVADGPHNVILDQVKNGVAIRMAVLFLLFGQESAGGQKSQKTPAAKISR